MTTADIPLADQIAEVKRELAMRENVYPKLIDSGRLTPAAAHRHLANMRAVLATLEDIDRINKEVGR